MFSRSNNFTYFNLFNLKYHVDREENYLKLLSHREKAKSDKYLVETHEKEHSRLIRVFEKTVQLNNGGSA
jgi:hypothetical protein